MTCDRLTRSEVWSLSSGCVAVLLAVMPAVAQDESKRLDFFQTQVVPLLKTHCYECHSHEAGEANGGLVLDSRGGWVKGGRLGPALVPGKPDESLLMKAVGYADEDLQMPPEEKLSADQIAILRRWIAEGAIDPRTGPAGGTDSGAVSADELWSYQPVANPASPNVSDEQWPLTRIDRFVLAGLDDAGLNPVGEATSATLIRRIFLDITGLPPSPEAVDRWMGRLSGDNARVDQQALGELVDELLASPQYGERWGRHWLDTARYGESNGNNRNRVFRFVWRYRNWVIDALNNDKPYDVFLKEQLAGDLMPSDSVEQRKQQRIATGFLAIGPKPYYPTIVPFDPEEPDRARYDWAAEQIDATFSGMMGLTVGCARCHDHKFDPVPTRDYYALAGIFRSTEPRFGMYYHLFGVPEGQAQRDFLYDWNLLVLNDELLDEIQPLQARYAPLAMEENQLERMASHLPRQIAALEEQLKSGRITDPAEMQRVRQEIETKRRQTDEGAKRLVEVRRLKAELKASFGFDVDQAMGVEDGTKPADSNIRIAGDHARVGPRVPRGFVSTIEFDGASTAINHSQSGRRELAEWIAHPNNPLTARVAVNRMWYHLFGRGIVNTLDNFGSSGEAPSHPELLDHLAHIFVHDLRWSQKQMIKLLVTSRVYQLASDESQTTPGHFEKDPQNTLYWRMSPRRLEAEAIRDSMLAVSGRLNRDRPKGSVLIEFEYRDDIVAGDLPKALNQLGGNYRTIYVPALRGHRHRLYDLFDYPDDEAVNSARNISTVPTQSLFLMNNPLIMSCAESLAARVDEECAGDVKRKIDRLYQLCFARLPTGAEVEADQMFLEQQQSVSSETAAWSRLAHTFLISGEFLMRF